MSGWKKLAAASAAGGAGPDVDEVFSTHLYYGNGSNRNIVNGLDLSGEGGITWVKGRTNGVPHYIANTESGGGGFHHRINDGQNTTTTAGITGFNSNGFSLGTATDFNYNNATYGHFASWSFRNHPSFFKVIKYTGNGTSQTINHGLDCEVGAVLVHSEDNSRDGVWWHRGLNNASNGTGYLLADSNQNETTASLIWNSTAPTSTTVSVGASTYTNSNNEEYIMYVFAHNDGDGVFGPNGDQDIIKCGVYTGTGSESINSVVDLGFEPQWIMVKRITGYDNWIMLDNMRGWFPDRYTNTNGLAVKFYTNTAGTESDDSLLYPLANGFALTNNSSQVNGDSQKYVYIAIRRGPLNPPTDAEDVFKAVYQSDDKPTAPSGFVTDMMVRMYSISNANYPMFSTRFQGKRYFRTSANASEATLSNHAWDFMDGFGDGIGGGTTNITYHCWKRAPQFLDLVRYDGAGTNGQRIDHQLGIVPSMIWIKRRDSSTDWAVWHKDLNEGVDAEDYHLHLNSSTTENTGKEFGQYNSYYPTETDFEVGESTLTNSTNGRYLAMVFGEIDGVSKMGRYTGNGTNQNIDCGFTNGARYILIKCVNSSARAPWVVVDHNRGINAGTEPTDIYSSGDANLTIDCIDPYSAGFNVVQEGNRSLNFNGSKYIYYAIA